MVQIFRTLSAVWAVTNLPSSVCRNSTCFVPQSVTPLSQNFQVKASADRFTRRKQFRAHNPRHVRETGDHCFHVGLGLSCFLGGSASFTLAGFAFCLGVVAVAQNLVSSNDLKKKRKKNSNFLTVFSKHGTQQSNYLFFRCQRDTYFAALVSGANPPTNSSRTLVTACRVGPSEGRPERGSNRISPCFKRENHS